MAVAINSFAGFEPQKMSAVMLSQSDERKMKYEGLPAASCRVLTEMKTADCPDLFRTLPGSPKHVGV